MAKEEITRSEWIERIKQHVMCMAALLMALLGDWSEMPNEEKQKALEEIKGEIDTAITMIKSRFMFNGRGKD